MALDPVITPAICAASAISQGLLSCLCLAFNYLSYIGCENELRTIYSKVGCEVVNIPNISIMHGAMNMYSASAQCIYRWLLVFNASSSW